MSLYRLVDDNGIEDHLDIRETTTGLGVFATRPYPATAVIGEITGELSRNVDFATDYTFDLDEGFQLEPFEPFRYVNHSCDANCEFDWLDEVENDPFTRRLYLCAYRDILPGEQLTIDYNWPAAYAIPCDCRSPLCRGWVVAPHELAAVALNLVESKRVPGHRPSPLPGNPTAPEE